MKKLTQKVITKIYDKFMKNLWFILKNIKDS